MRLRTLAALLSSVLAFSVAAQDVRITNIANTSRKQWVEVAVPASDAASLPALCRLDPQGFIALRGGGVGLHSVMYHVYAALQPGQSITGRLIPVSNDPSLVPPFAMTDWVADDTLALIPRPGVFANGVEHRLGSVVFDMVESNRARQVFRLRGRMGDLPLVFEEWIYVYSYQDLVKVEMTFTNNDPRFNGMSWAFDHLWVETGEYFRVDYHTTLGLQAPGLQTRWPGHPSYGQWVQAVSGSRFMGRGEQIFLSGWLCPLPSRPMPNRSIRYTAGGMTMDVSPAERTENFVAAFGGPGVGLYHDWAGKWLGFGMLPEVPVDNRASGGWSGANASAAAFASLMTQRRDLYSARPRGLFPGAGSTGAQEDFGACKGAFAVTVGDPRFIWEIGYSTYDAFARPYHYREADSAPMDQSFRSGLRTWSQLPNCRTTFDPMGYPCPLPYSWYSNGWTTWDDQHRSQNNINALLALGGSYALRASLSDLLEVDLTQQPNRIDSPRAEGRLAMAWSSMFLLLDDPADRQRLLTHMSARLTQVTTLWPGARFVNNPLKPIRALEVGRDPSFYEPGGTTQVPSIIVWEHSIAVMGFYAGWRVTGDVRYRDMAAEVAKLILNHCIFQENGRWVACTAVRYLQGAQEGDPLPPTSYRSVGSPDVHVGAYSFWDWILPAVLIGRDLFRNDPAMVARCNAMLTDVAPNGPIRWEQAEWWAVLPR
jgi:hypothetical protein